MRYPVAIWTALGTLLSTGVALVAIFYPGLEPPAQAAIIAFGAAVLGVAQAILGSAAVTPVADPYLQEGATYTIVTPEGQLNRQAVAR